MSIILKNEQLELLKEALFDFKHTLLHQQEQFHSEKAAELNKYGSLTGGELSQYDNHPADAGTDLYDRTRQSALEEHNNRELTNINRALEAIAKETYGICIVCGKDIPFERLQAVPTAVHCHEHANTRTDLHHPSTERIDANIRVTDHIIIENSNDVVDFEDSFREVARYGTSETPSDFSGDYDSYNEFYDEEDKEPEF